MILSAQNGAALWAVFWLMLLAGVLYAIGHSRSSRKRLARVIESRDRANRKVWELSNENRFLKAQLERLMKE